MKKPPRPATIIDGLTESERLIVTPLAETIVVELHRKVGDNYRVSFIEIHPDNALDLADALREHAQKKK